MKALLSITALLVAVATVADAADDGHNLRHLLGMRVPTPCYYEKGFDYIGNDIAHVPGGIDTCCTSCAANPLCRAWSWSNYNGGMCWLKSVRNEIAVNKDVTSSNVSPFPVSTLGPYCQYSDDVDFVGNNIGSKPSADPAGCCSICQNFLGCRAYSWSNYNGGTCWLKSKSTVRVYMPGTKAAQAYPFGEGSCGPADVGFDYVDNDVGNKPSPTADGCCAICKEFKDCRAYTWTNYNGGTCWLKSIKADVVPKAGAISVQVYSNPAPACTFTANTDFYGMDLASRPSVDPLDCCSMCRDLDGCKAITWTPLNGGTCFLKSGAGTSQYKIYAKSAVIA